MYYSRSAGVGQYVASEKHNVLWERLTKPGHARCVVCAQGSHGLADTLLFQDSWQRSSALMDAGFMLIQGDLAQTLTQGTFGNDTAQQRLDQLRTYVQGSASPMQAASGKIHLIGGSGGCTACINYARAHPGNVASMYLIVPLVDIDNFYFWHFDASIPQAEVDTAYGGARAAAMATHSPVKATDLANLKNIPIRMAYSDSDPYIDVNTVKAFASAVNAAGGQATYYSQGAVGHSGIGVPPQDVVSFFQANNFN